MPSSLFINIFISLCFLLLFYCEMNGFKILLLFFFSFRDIIFSCCSCILIGFSNFLIVLINIYVKYTKFHLSSKFFQVIPCMYNKTFQFSLTELLYYTITQTFYELSYSGKNIFVLNLPQGQNSIIFLLFSQQCRVCD